MGKVFIIMPILVSFFSNIGYNDCISLLVEAAMIFTEK